MQHLFLSFITVSIVSLVSLIGVTTLILKKEVLEVVVHYLIAFATGALLATVFFELLPEAVELSGNEFSSNIGFLVIGAIAISFIIERTIKWHSHHSVVKPEEHLSPLLSSHEKGSSNQIKPYVYNILIGDGIHNFVDGLALVVSFNLGISFGLAMFISILVHEIAQEFGDFGILVHGGLSIKKALTWNFLSAIPALFGVLIGAFLLLSDNFVNVLTIIIVSISAGIFLYISTSDLIPELTEELSLVKSMAHICVGTIGVAIIYVLTLFE